ncbi:MAG: ABC transporter permease [Bdellovibrionaceae bacterium]|nr:ABC transporter permease [Pseudobdellovibrionaceae bacterium]
MISVQNLSKVYRMGEHEVHALSDVSLTIEPGDFVAIMGPSGSGKSTLMQILGLLDTPSSGSYKLYGREVAGLSDDELAILRREKIGFIFQQFHLLSRMTARENVVLPLFYSQRLEQSGPQGDRLLKMVNLSSHESHRPNEMSGGQQQRVAIARALVNEPTIIFADEPTGNLDSKSEHEIIEILRSLNSSGITVIMVTHEDEIGRQAKRLIRMRDGKVQSDTRLTPIEPTTAPVTPDKTTPGTSSLSATLGLHLVQAMRTLIGNKVRSALSVLGILIGVAAVVAMLALGRGAQVAIESQLSSLGSNLLVLRSGPSRMGGVAMDSTVRYGLDPDDGDAIKREVGGLRDVAPNVSGRAQVDFKNRNWSTQVLATTPSYESMRAATPIIGRFFTEAENRSRSRVALLGATVVRELFGRDSPIGEMVRLNRIAFQVIGILPEKGASGWRDQDDTIVIPLATGMYRLFGKQEVDSIDIEMLDSAQAETIQEDILMLMKQRHRVPATSTDEAFSVNNMADIQKAMSQSSQTLSLLLAAIAAISLLVGGIGIMNIMLVSVTERTREIGLRKAIGAQRIDILYQFLTESLVISLVGGTAGVVLGVSATMLLQTTTGWTMQVSLSSIALAFGFSASIGVIFGLYPARKASYLNPITALRHD